jgi:hypothetical protein
MELRGGSVIRRGLCRIPLSGPESDGSRGRCLEWAVISKALQCGPDV